MEGLIGENVPGKHGMSAMQEEEAEAIKGLGYHGLRSSEERVKGRGQPWVEECAFPTPSGLSSTLHSLTILKISIFECTN